MKPAPIRRSPEIIQAAFEAFWPKLEKWLKSEGAPIEGSKEEALKILTQNSWEEDGFVLAKEFDHSCWQPNAELVDILDGWGHELYAAHAKAVEAWVISEGITPKLAIGTKVKINVVVGWKKEIREGVINAIHAKRGDYSVYVESLGHIVSGSGKSGVTGVFASFAELEALNGVPA